MKVTAALLIATAALAAAKPHHHRHRHLSRRAPSADGVTVVVYELNGNPIPYDQVDEGIKNGTLVWAEGGGSSSTSSAASSTSSTTTSTVSIPSTTSSTSTTSTLTTPTLSPSSSLQRKPIALKPPPQPTHETAAQQSSATAPSTQPTQQSSAPSSQSATNVQTPFPDGQLDCSTFPAEYGAVAVDWLKLGGWTGVQTPGTKEAKGFNDIVTAISGGCSEGSYCSYACPAGYQKSQWPSIQGATGQSIGGILCRAGKLHLTNAALSKTLCTPGTNQVLVQIENKLTQNAAVCRTDYPGTEAETIPLDTQPGTTQPLTCPDAATYYKWLDGSTSAQYYVNPAGVAVQDACQWGSAAQPWGNWAPLNIGVGYSAGSAWLSIFQNAPTTTAQLDFAVEIVGTDGGYGNLGGRCRYSQGRYCTGENYEDCSAGGNGCTVAVTGGSATFVFS